jgi:hypothetical protein
MAQTSTTSTQFSWNLSDILKGLVIAVILPVLTIIQNSIQAGSFTLDWKNIGLMAIGGFIAYMIKNFFTPSAIVIKNAPPTTVAAVKSGTVEMKAVAK